MNTLLVWALAFLVALAAFFVFAVTLGQMVMDCIIDIIDSFRESKRP